MSERPLSERLTDWLYPGMIDTDDERQQKLYDLVDEAAGLARHVEKSTRVWVYWFGDILRTTPPPPGTEDYVQAHCALVPVDLSNTELEDILAKRRREAEVANG